MQDTGFVAVHIIHGSNTSYAYRQQLLPKAFGKPIFRVSRENHEHKSDEIVAGLAHVIN
jgi:hypothetical protein